jgi:hypothetical protein
MEKEKSKDRGRATRAGRRRSSARFTVANPDTQRFWAGMTGKVVTALALNLAAISWVQCVGVVALFLTGFVNG